MRIHAICLTAGLALLAGALAHGGEKGAKPGATCGDFGTSIVFADSPREAAQQAAKEQKLVMVLHISGHFEDPGLT